MGEVLKLHSGDSKLYDGEIFTTIGRLYRYDLNGVKIKEYNDIKSNWIDIDDNVLIYGNFDNQIGIAQMDSNKEILWQETIFSGENLMIDPTILRVNDTWYITFTTIEGTINNADPAVTNGVYTVEMYQSTDLHNWEKLSTIINAENNIEDPDLMYEDGQFYFAYEKEVLDKGASSICIKKSTDGINWSEEQEILPAVADQEPGSYEKLKDGYALYYSSDKDNLGESYMGAKLYYALLDKNFNLLEKDKEIGTDAVDGILLYDVCWIDGKQYFLMSHNIF